MEPVVFHLDEKRLLAANCGCMACCRGWGLGCGVCRGGVVPCPCVRIAGACALARAHGDSCGGRRDADRDPPRQVDGHGDFQRGHAEGVLGGESLALLREDEVFDADAEREQDRKPEENERASIRMLSRHLSRRGGRGAGARVTDRGEYATREGLKTGG